MPATPELEVLLVFIGAALVANLFCLAEGGRMLFIGVTQPLSSGAISKKVIVISVLASIIIAGLICFLLMEIQTARGAGIAALLIVPQIHGGQLINAIIKRNSANGR